MASIVERAIGAMKLNAATFEEVEHDEGATLQAAAVVVVTSFATGVGWFFWLGGVYGVVRGALFALVAWVIFAAILWLVGTRLLPGRATEADIGQVLRTVGFAQAPAIFGVFALIPLLGVVVAFVVSVWVLVATVIAVRQALDYDDTFRAVVVCAIAWVAELAFVLITGFGTRVLI